MELGWAGLAAASVLVMGCTGDGAAPAVPETTVVAVNATLERVVDGDTIVADISGHRETVRLIGIDTPETVKPNAPVECYGPEASAFTKHLLPAGTALHIERDAEARDDYGRLLGYVYLAADGTFVNLEIVRRGYATLLTFPPNTTHVDELVAAATAAERAGLGLWGTCSG